MAKTESFRWLDRRIALAGPYLTLVLSEAEYFAAVKHLGAKNPGPWIKTPQSHATAHYFERPGKALAVIVALSEGPGRDPIEIAGLLVHEAVHVWQQYAADMGEREPAAEQEAYAIQSIAQELMAEFARRMKQ